MKISLLPALLLLAPMLRAQPASETPADPGPDVASLTAGWPRASLLVVRAMVEEYGQPAEGSPEALVWRNSGPWKKTVVRRAAEGSETEVLQQFLSYRVPLDKFDELGRFDARLAADRARGELSCRSESEKLNFLALNLAHEIITGKRTAEEARRVYAQTAAMEQSGKSSPYTAGLLFQPEKPRLRLRY